MRKILSLTLALVLCCSLAVTATATEFVPSISYKDGPVIVSAQMQEESVKDCLVVTSIMAAKEKKTDIPQESRDLLLDVYEKLDNGTMKLPMEKDGYVVRELVDISFAESACVQPDHGHDTWLAEEKNTIRITVKLGVAAATKVAVLAYVGDTWVPAAEVVNNGDGTVSCVMEELCPVAFCVGAHAERPSPSTGDRLGMLLMPMLVVAVASMAVLATIRFRSKAKW
ncbi:MAG: hypothetical protein IJD98_05985 [Oscillospiraceae bacterium]|nr:hypothetical protein [Oscillospiraceae bacterium]